ncbi:membrane protein [Oceanobacillus zhaokaii]|uniref:Membrane protein n=1 Tax=Oceanobacillus zhaokaii TaxID=2052660 RepID=A0A345PCJ3_9BACI|nr:YitT family protein [Oceanobacillus zhaokaii]AXI07723.1 membrane protein [Oceanobacillus zhaokaii]
MKQFISKFVLVILGGIFQGFGMGLFLFPNYIPSGGAGGIAVLIHYWFGMNIGLALWLVNASMLYFGVKILGKRFALWTILGITVTSISLHIFGQTFSPNRILWFDVFAGSIFLGTGIGILMRQRVSNGGIGILAMIISVRRNILPGKPLFFVNIAIFLLTAVVIDWKIIILAFLSQWISTIVIDQICQFSFWRTYTLNWRKK